MCNDEFLYEFIHTVDYRCSSPQLRFRTNPANTGVSLVRLSILESVSERSRSAIWYVGFMLSHEVNLTREYPYYSQHGFE
jgi:hypothetical protein